MEWHLMAVNGIESMEIQVHAFCWAWQQFMADGNFLREKGPNNEVNTHMDTEEITKKIWTPTKPVE